MYTKMYVGNLIGKEFTMHKHLINFEGIPWVQAGRGIRYKVFKSDIQQIRLVEFSEGFMEEDWCLRGHAGYVLEGSCIIDFNGEKELFSAGDTMFIAKGEEDKHKVIMDKEGRVLMLLFEII